MPILAVAAIVCILVMFMFRRGDHFDCLDHFQEIRAYLLQLLSRPLSVFACFKIMSRSALTLRRIIAVATTSAVPVVRASGRPAAGHPVPDFVAADQASDLVGRLGLDCSCDCLDLGLKLRPSTPAGISPAADDASACAYVTGIPITKGCAQQTITNQ